MNELSEFHSGSKKNPEKKYQYELFDVPKLKAPLSILRYNLNFEFEDSYPAKIPQDFARDMIKMYSKTDDLVWDGA